MYIRKSFLAQRSPKETSTHFQNLFQDCLGVDKEESLKTKFSLTENSLFLKTQGRKISLKKKKLNPSTPFSRIKLNSNVTSPSPIMFSQSAVINKTSQTPSMPTFSNKNVKSLYRTNTQHSKSAYLHIEELRKQIHREYKSKCSYKILPDPGQSINNLSKKISIQSFPQKSTQITTEASNFCKKKKLHSGEFLNYSTGQTSHIRRANVIKRHNILDVHLNKSFITQSHIGDQGTNQLKSQKQIDSKVKDSQITAVPSVGNSQKFGSIKILERVLTYKDVIPEKSQSTFHAIMSVAELQNLKQSQSSFSKVSVMGNSSRDMRNRGSFSLKSLKNEQFQMHNPESPQIRDAVSVTFGEDSGTEYSFVIQ